MAKDSEQASNSKFHVPNLERALKIMELLGEHSSGLGITEIVEILTIPKNSVYRITQTLYSFGYLNRHEDSKRFYLSRKLLALGHKALSEQNILEVALGHMRSLSEELNISVFIGTLLDKEGVVLGSSPAGHPFKLDVDAGTRFNLHCSAPGKAMMAYMAGAQQKEMLKALSYEQFTESTLKNSSAMKKELDLVLKEGLAYDREEEFEGISCVAAPVFNQFREAIASIWISSTTGLLKRAGLEKIEAGLLKTAKQISTDLGYEIL